MDIAVIIFYLAIVLLVGIRRGYRTKNIRDFAVGDKNFNFAVLLATISATYTGGGSTLGNAERIFNHGVFYVFIAILCPVTYKIIVASLITPKFASLQRYISFGELMGGLYKKPAQIISGLFGSIQSIGFFGTQTAAMGFILQYFLGTSFEFAVIVSTGIVIIYTTFGGIKAVAATDFIQFAVLLVGIVIIANFALVRVGGYEALWLKLPETRKVFLPDGDMLISNLVLMFILTFPFMNPTQVQRLLLSDDIKKTQKSMYAAAAIDPIIFFLIACIGLCAIVITPDIKPDLAMLSVIDEVLPTAFLRGLCISGLLAVVMSTADSCLNSATVAIVNDCIIPLKKTRFTTTFEVWLIKVVTILLGSGSIVIALYFENLIDIVVAFMSFWGTFMCVPFFAGLYHLHATEKSFWASTILGMPTFFIWSYFFETSTGIHAVFPGLLLSAVGFFSVYFYQKSKGELVVSPKKKVMIATRDDYPCGDLIGNISCGTSNKK